MSVYALLQMENEEGVKFLTEKLASSGQVWGIKLGDYIDALGGVLFQEIKGDVQVSVEKEEGDGVGGGV